MRTPLTSRRLEFLKGILLFFGFGMCLSCLSVMERRMGLVGRDSLQPTRPALSIPRIGDNLSGITFSADTGTFFAVVEERRGMILLVRIDADTRVISAD